MTSLELARLYADRVFPAYGLPDKIISDWDPRVTSDLFQDLCNILGIKQNISTVYHPQTDGQSERTNQTMEVVLHTLCDANAQDWAKWLPIVTYAMNFRPS